MTEPVPEPAGEPEPPEPPRRPVLSPDPEQTWRPGPRRPVPYQREYRPFWRLESHQYVLLLMAVVAVVMLVMFGLLVSSFFHAVASPGG